MIENKHVVKDWYDRICPTDVLDGLSNTFLVGERHIMRELMNHVPDDGPLYDGSRFYYMSRIGDPKVPLAQGPDDEVFAMARWAFGSWHPGICNFAFADGRVTSVRNEISTSTLARLCHRSDGQFATTD